MARPTVAAEYAHFRHGQTLLCFLRLAVASPDLLVTLWDAGSNTISWELVEAPDGCRPELQAMSRIAGRMAPILAGRLLQTTAGGRGILLNGLPGVPPASVVIVGAGTLGTQAALASQRLGARVMVLDNNMSHLAQLDKLAGSGMASLPATLIAIAAPQFREPLHGFACAHHFC